MERIREGIYFSLSMRRADVAGIILVAHSFASKNSEVALNAINPAFRA